MIKFYKQLFFWTFFCYADGDGGGESGSEGDTGEGDKGGGSEGGEGGDKGGEGDKGAAATKEELDGAISAEDWRADLPDDLKKTADRFSSREDAVRAIQAFQKRDGQVRVPGKDASDEEVAKFQKAMGIPEKADGYEFPEMAEGQELTDEIKTSRVEWGKRFHDMGISADQAKLLSQLVGEDSEKIVAAQVQADKDFAQTQEDALRQEWKGDDFEKNKTLANRAFTELADRTGLNIDDLAKIETKDGRFLMDRVEMLKIFSVIGREMAEGTLGPAVSETERETVEDEIRTIRTQIAEAQNKNDSKRANQLYTKEQNLLKRMGDQPVVGSAGRAA